jgi:protocatechuate 3,4-dioxygenase beta subunit
MPRRPLALLLVLIAGIGFGLVCLVRSIGPRDLQTTPPAAAAPAVATLPEAPAEAPKIDAKAPEIESSEPSSTREAAPAGAASSAASPDPKDLRWIEGRVVFPANTPADERAEVISARRGSDETHAARAPVAADGSFRIGVPKTAKNPKLDLRARYAYLLEPVDVPESEPAVLKAKLGGCIHGRLILPANALDRRASVVGTEIRASASADSGNFGFSRQLERHARADDSLEFEIGGIPDQYRVWIDAQPKGMARASDDGAHAKPGLVASLDLELLLGAHISGRVLDEQGAPLAGVRIAQHGERAMSTWSNDGGEKTDADGTFDVTGIQPCKLTIEGKKDGYASTSLLVGDLADGAVRDGLELRLGRGLSISGRVQWPDGRPAGGCSVDADFDVKYPGRYAGTRTEQRSCKSGDDGTFTLSGLGSEPVTLGVRVGIPGPPRMGHSGDEAGDEAKPSKEPAEPAERGFARLEDVQPGTTGVVLTLQPDKVVRGRALDDAGQPIADLKISAEPVDGSQPWERSRKAVRGSSSSKDGAFELGGLHDGAWDVTAESEGHAKSSAHRVAIPADSEAFVLVLPRVSSVSGTVTDPAGAPVEGAMVRADPPDEQRGFVFGVQDRKGAKTDAQGKFDLANVAPGPVKVVAAAAGFAESQALALELKPGQSMPDLALALRRPGRIVGEVLDDAGHPRAAGRVTAHNGTGRGYQQTNVDASGHFEIEALAPGKYWVQSMPSEKEMEAMASDKGELDQVAWARQQKQTTATVAEGETTHVVLGGTSREGVRVFGKVTCGERPVANCLLWLYRADGQNPSTQSGATDADGKYELTVDGAGKYGFNVNDPKSGTSFSDQVTVPSQASFEHDIVLPASRIAGRVLGIDGAPAVGVSVVLQPDGRTAELSSSASYGQKETDEKGAFVFEGLKGATYRLQAGDSPWSGGSGKVGSCTKTGIVLPEGGHIDGLEVRLQATARIEGSVTGPDGQALAGATIIARDDQGNVIERWPPAVSDSSGRFAIDGLTPGQATVTARTSKLVSPESPPLTLRSGETSKVELAARAGTILRVIVQESDGTAVGASVSVTDDRGRDVGRGYGFAFDLGGDSSPEAGQMVGPILPGSYKVTATNHDRKSVTQDVSVSGDEQVVTLKYGG